MNGLIVVDKKEGYTSRDVVNLVSKYIGVKKVGHTGTLDPLATGVLVIVVGKATKLVEELTSHEKEYVADVKLGIDTDTLDVTGTILKEETTNISSSKIQTCLDEMKGTYLQEVPKYSAIKVNGRKLYEYARKNEDVILPKKEVTIKKIELLDTWREEKHTCFKMETLVSKGTYIRSLIRDIAKKLGTCGVMTSLRRTRQGKFTLEDAYTLEEIQNGNYRFISLLEIFDDIPKREIPSDFQKKITNGNVIPNLKGEEQVLFTKDGEAFALYHVKEDKNYLKPKIMF